MSRTLQTSRAKSLPLVCRLWSDFDRLGVLRPQRVAPTSAGVRMGRVSALPRKRIGKLTSPLEKVLQTLEGIRKEFKSAQSGGGILSLAELDCFGWMRRCRAGCEKCRLRYNRSLHAGTHSGSLGPADKK